MLVFQRAGKLVVQVHIVSGRGVAGAAFYPHPVPEPTRLVAHQRLEGIVRYLEFDVVGLCGHNLVSSAVIVENGVLAQRDGRHLRFRLRDAHHDVRGTGVERAHRVAVLVILYLDAVGPFGLLRGLKVEEELVRGGGETQVLNVFVFVLPIPPVLQLRPIAIRRARRVGGIEIEGSLMAYAFGKSGNRAVFGLAGDLERQACLGPLRVQGDGVGFVVSVTVQVVGAFADPFRVRVVSIFHGRPTQECAGVVFVVGIVAGGRGQCAHRLVLHDGLLRARRIRGAAVSGSVGLVQVELHGSHGGLVVSVERDVAAVDALARVAGIRGLELPGRVAPETALVGRIGRPVGKPVAFDLGGERLQRLGLVPPNGLFKGVAVRGVYERYRDILALADARKLLGASVHVVVQVIRGVIAAEFARRDQGAVARGVADGTPRRAFRHGQRVPDFRGHGMAEQAGGVLSCRGVGLNGALVVAGVNVKPAIVASVQVSHQAAGVADAAKAVDVSPVVAGPQSEPDALGERQVSHQAASGAAELVVRAVIAFPVVSEPAFERAAHRLDQAVVRAVLHAARTVRVAQLHDAARNAAGMPLRRHDLAEVRAALDDDATGSVVEERADEAAGRLITEHGRLVRAILYLELAVFGGVALGADGLEQRGCGIAAIHIRMLRRADEMKVFDFRGARAAGLAAGCEQGAVFAAGELELDRVAVAVEFRRLQVGVIHLVDDVVGDGAAVHRAVGTRSDEVVHKARVLLALLNLAHGVQPVAPCDEVVRGVDEHGVVGRAGALQLVGRVGGRRGCNSGQRE